MATYAGVIVRGLDKDHFISWRINVVSSDLELVNVKAGAETVIFSESAPVWWSEGNAIWLRLRIHYNQAACFHSQDGLTWTRSGGAIEFPGMQAGTAWTWANFSTNGLIPNCTGRLGVTGRGWSDETDTY